MASLALSPAPCKAHCATQELGSRTSYSKAYSSKACIQQGIQQGVQTLTICDGRWNWVVYRVPYLGLAVLNIAPPEPENSGSIANTPIN
jgi:hypothetical protein